MQRMDGRRYHVHLVAILALSHRIQLHPLWLVVSTEHRLDTGAYRSMQQGLQNYLTLKISGKFKISSLALLMISIVSIYVINSLSVKHSSTVVYI